MTHVDDALVTSDTVDDIYPLSPMQKGMLFHTLLTPDARPYFEQAEYTASFDVDLAAFRKAWQTVVDRHAILRTGIQWQGLEEPLQFVRREVEVPFVYEDWRDLPADVQRTRLASFLEEDRRNGFDLTRAPLMRLALFQMSDGAHFVWTQHHLLLDGWSTSLVMNEVASAYGAARAGRVPHLPPAPSYRAYIDWFQRQDLGKAEEYWREKLRGFSAATPLPFAAPPRTGEDHQGFAIREARLAVESTSSLRELTRRERITFNTLVQAAWTIFLSRCGGESDVVFGITVAGRPASLPGAERTVGMFMNTLPLRITVDPRERLRSFLKRIQAEQLDVLQFESTPLFDIQSWCQIPAGQPLFESFVVFENYPHQLLGADEQQPAMPSFTEQRQFKRGAYPLEIQAGVGSTLGLRLSYDRARFVPEIGTELLPSLVAILSYMAAHDDCVIGDIPLVGSDQLASILAESRGPASVSDPALVLDMFDRAKASGPQSTAVISADDRLTYAELDERSRRIACALRARGARPDSRIVICGAPGVDLVAAIFGVLRSGAAYVPVPSDIAPPRLAQLVADAAPTAVLVDATEVDRLALDPAIVLTIERAGRELMDAEQPFARPSPRSLAYLIYTSGSTGAPKAVAVQHGSLAASTAARDQFYGAPPERYLLLSPFFFDSSVAGIFWTLCRGGTLVLADRAAQRDPAAIRQLIADHDITHLLCLPSIYGHVLDGAGSAPLSGLRTVIVAGETVTPTLVERHAQKLPGVVLCNEYGPTEGTVWATAQRCDTTGARVPIGEPIAGTTAYVVDTHGFLVPAGVAGELWIGGDGVTRGYWGYARGTAERFVPDGFSGVPGARLYRTGDLVQRSQGRIDFLGRIDHQVKIRGCRVEPAEIEGALAARGDLAEVVVAAREAGNGDRRLIAYYVPREGAAPTADELRQWLDGRMPEYMVPSTFVPLATMPRTATGKVDRRLLPAPDAARVEPVAAAGIARDTTELLLGQLWEDVLGVTDIRLDDDFFELGGHSLSAIALVTRLGTCYGREIPIRTLFAHRTVAKMAEFLRREVAWTSPSCLVPIQSRGIRRPLFCVHLGGGLVNAYVPLSRHLGPDQPMYGLQSIGLDPGQEPLTAVEAMATRYIEEVRAVQPNGPYQLAGLSMGCVVAFEMAQQLTRKGEQVAVLALLDGSPAREPVDFFADGWAAAIEAGEDDHVLSLLQKDLGVACDDLLGLPRDERLARCLEECRRRDRVPPDVGLLQFKRFMRVFATNARAMSSYRPSLYEGPVLFVHSSMPEGMDPTYGWGAVVSGGLDVHEVPGEHGSCVQEPQVHRLAAILETAMSRAAHHDAR
jgi:amino acid adenylation domain-containing protein